MLATYNACTTTTWTLRLWAPLVARNKILVRKKHKRISNVRKQLKKREENKYVLVKFHFWLTSLKDLNFPWLEVRFLHVLSPALTISWPVSTMIWLLLPWQLVIITILKKKKRISHWQHLCFEINHAMVHSKAEILSINISKQNIFPFRNNIQFYPR